MNARQAAKKWKRKYNELINAPQPIKITTRAEVVTLRAARTIHGFDYYHLPVDFMDKVAEELLPLAKDFIDYETIETPEGNIIITGKLLVVKR